MRPLASLSLVALPLLLSLCGCATIASSPFEGIGKFVSDTHDYNLNPNRPIGSSETMRRVLGLPAEADPLTPETGNVWPVGIEPSTTLSDLAKAGNDGLLKPNAEITLPAAIRNTALPPAPAAPGPAAAPAPAPVTTPAPKPAPAPQATIPTPLPASPALTAVAPTTPPALKPATAPAISPPTTPLRTINTPNGPATLSGGPGVMTYTDSTGKSGLVVPNGNGTSTLIAPDGSVQTVPTPQ
jgi:hypothetical protein